MMNPPTPEEQHNYILTNRERIKKLEEEIVEQKQGCIRCKSDIRSAMQIALEPLIRDIERLNRKQEEIMNNTWPKSVTYLVSLAFTIASASISIAVTTLLHYGS